MNARPLAIAAAATVVLAALLVLARHWTLASRPVQGAWVDNHWRTPAALAGKWWTLSGRVVDPMGRPAPGVELRGTQPPVELACAKHGWPGVFDCLCNSTVRSYAEARARSPLENVYGVTAADGSFKIDLPQDEPFVRLSSVLGFAMLTPTRSEEGLEVALTTPTVQEFTVTYPNGEPADHAFGGSIDLPNAVRFVQPKNNVYSLSPAGWPFAWAPGFGVVNGSLFSPPGQPVTLQLKPVARMTGVVLRGDTPVSGAEVTFGAERCEHTALTDPNGAFSFEDEGAMSFKRVIAVDGSDAAFGDFGSGNGPLTLRLQPNAGPLLLDLRSPEGVLAHQLVTLEVQPTGSSSKLRFSERTDERGRVSFAALPKGYGTLSVWGYEVPAALKSLTLNEPRRDRLTVQLAEERRLYLKVVDSSGALVHRIHLDGPNGPIGQDSSGIALIRNLPPEGAALTIGDGPSAFTVKVAATGDRTVTLPPLTPSDLPAPAP